MIVYKLMFKFRKITLKFFNYFIKDTNIELFHIPSRL